jgi:hypothetical protein
MKKYRTSKTANHTYFNTIDTEEKAYLLGFILADGCVQQGYGINTVVLHNAVDDLEAGLLFQKEIFPGNKMLFRKNPGKKDTFSVKGSSKEIIKDLAKFNIKPRKTFDFDFMFNFEHLPKEFTRHFIRGFFDGDGTFSNYRFEFITTSEKFMYQIIEIIVKEFNCKYTIKKRQTKNVIEYMFSFHNGNNGKNLSFKQNFMKHLYKWFYENSNCYLTRKKSKLEEYLNIVLNSNNKKLESV